MKPANFCVLTKKPPNQTKAKRFMNHMTGFFAWGAFSNNSVWPRYPDNDPPKPCASFSLHLLNIQPFWRFPQYVPPGQETNNLQWNLELCQAGQSLKHTTTKAHEYQKDILAILHIWMNGMMHGKLIYHIYHISHNNGQPNPKEQRVYVISW